MSRAAFQLQRAAWRAKLKLERAAAREVEARRECDRRREITEERRAQYQRALWEMAVMVSREHQERREMARRHAAILGVRGP